jgi:hypothetical protein
MRFSTEQQAEFQWPILYLGWAGHIAKTDSLPEAVKFNNSFGFVQFQWVHALKFMWGWVC